jgi:hypothetical protein
MRDRGVPLIDDDEAAAIQAAVIARHRVKARVAARSRKKDDSRRARLAKRKADATTTFPVEITGVYTEDLGEVTLHLDALANALVIREQRRDPATFPIAEGLQLWQKVRLARKYRNAHKPHAKRLAISLPTLMQEWLSGLLEEWTREETLQRLEKWPQAHAAAALKLATVQRHITQIRTGRSEADAAARKRLEKALARLATVPPKRGRPARLEPVSPDSVRLYERVLPMVQQLRKGHDGETFESMEALKGILYACAIPATGAEERRWLHHLMGGLSKPHRVAAMLAAATVEGESYRRIEAAVRALPKRTQN